MQDQSIYNNQLHFYISNEQCKNENKKAKPSNGITQKEIALREDKILRNKFNKRSVKFVLNKTEDHS